MQTHKMILQDESIIHQLLRLTQNESTQIAREATIVISNLLFTVSTHELFLKNSGMVSMAKASKISHIKCASNSSTHEAFFNVDSINAVINTQ